MRFLACLLLASLPLAAQSLQVDSGAADYQVFQRGPANTATISIQGAVLAPPVVAAAAKGRKTAPPAPAESAVEARLVAAGRVVAGFDWKPVGKAVGARFQAGIAAVPTGGPYRLDLRLAGLPAVTSLSSLLVGDLWLLAGQSNMEGVGNLAGLPLPSAQVNSFDMSDVWVAAADPLHSLPDSADRVHWRKNAQGQLQRLTGEAQAKYIATRRKGAGVGLPFALEMLRRTGVPVGLLPCAHGGTSMDQWDPALKDQGGDSLYGGMLRRFKLAGGKVKGVLWYQGESDANPKAAPLFEAKFKALIQAIRADFGQPELPFLYVQIGRHVDQQNVAPWHAVQDAQLRVESALLNLGMVTCVDCELDDGIHVGTDQFARLAVRLANLATVSTRRGPRPASARASDGVIRVAFDEVNGRLVSAGRLNGFSVHDASGAYLPLVYRQRLSRTDPNVVELLFSGKLPEGAQLHYGYGKDPYVNLADEARMAAPVFGPLPILQ